MVVPGFEPQGEERLRIGDSLLLRRPDGAELRTTVGGIEMFGPGARRRVFPILLKGLTNDEAPIGTEVWSSP